MILIPQFYCLTYVKLSEFRVHWFKKVFPKEYRVNLMLKPYSYCNINFHAIQKPCNFTIRKNKYIDTTYNFKAWHNNYINFGWLHFGTTNTITKNIFLSLYKTDLKALPIQEHVLYETALMKKNTGLSMQWSNNKFLDDAKPQALFLVSGNTAFSHIEIYLKTTQKKIFITRLPVLLYVWSV
jgi:hypothetical protein